MPNVVTVFDKLFQDARAAGVRAGFQSAQSIDWLLAKARQFQNSAIPDNELSNDRRSLNVLGEMFFFHYDPKLKDSLPYYDTFPLVFPFKRYNDGFLGINFHYLPPIQRIKLLSALTSIAASRNNNKLSINYEILKSFSELKSSAPCVKRYLSSHVRSRFIAIPRKEWEMAVALPLARFQKTQQQVVWNQSKRNYFSHTRNKKRNNAIRGF